MEYYNKTLCISARELVDSGIMSASNYKQLSARGQMTIARRGGGGSGNYALVELSSLPQAYKDKVNALYPDIHRVMLQEWVRSNYEVDQSATAYYHSLEQTGRPLPPAKIREYVTNASVLNCCIRLYERASTAQRLFGESYNWDKMTDAIESLRELYKHTLPASTLRFRKKVSEYRKEGYASLISGKFGNQSRRKVDNKTERLIVSIATLPNKPYKTQVHELYNMFVCGELDVWDYDTGELYSPEEFTDRNGNPKVLGETTINNYLNKPKNRLIISKALSSYTTFMHEQMPHVHRHAPEFSFSKISFDDRDLPRKLKETKARPKAYYAYDVTSQAVVGVAYNRRKDVDLVVDMFRSMFRLIERKGWMCPAQVEVENHLMSQWRDNFLKAGVMFPFVRFCAPQNSQEKYAEALNGAKKRSIEHRNHLGIGRFYAKNPAYRTEARKVYDAYNDTYEDKQYYSWEELIADDMQDVQEFNNSLHPNQKKYPGMTRWQVLENNMNPTLQPLDKAVLARYIGEKVSTSIRRNSYCRVAHTDWWLSHTSVLERLAPGNLKVDAYYLTEEDGSIRDVYIYQQERLIDKLQDVGTFNSADCEQTDEDRAVFVTQQKKIASFSAYVAAGRVPAVGVSPKRSYSDEVTPVEELSLPRLQETDSLPPLPPINHGLQALYDL